MNVSDITPYNRIVSFWSTADWSDQNCLLTKRSGSAGVRHSIFFAFSVSVSVSVLYWKLTQSLSKSYPGVCLVSRAKLQLWSLLQFCCSRHFLLACSNLSQFLGRKHVYISMVTESSLICLLLDVLDGRWLYSILLSAGLVTRSLTILKRRTSLCSFLLWYVNHVGHINKY